jgi:hypothetical protein
MDQFTLQQMIDIPSKGIHSLVEEHMIIVFNHFTYSIFIRSLWCIVVILAFAFGLSMVYNIIANWQASPVVVTIENDNYPISEVHFPSVTICSTTKVTPEKLVSEVCRLE